MAAHDANGESLRYPDFLGIGAQRAATTWLYRRLERQHGIWLPPVKELHYFDRLYLDYPKHPKSGLTPMDGARAARCVQQIGRIMESKLANPAKLKKIQLVSLVGLSELTDRWYGSIFRDAFNHLKCGEITPEYAMLPAEGISHILRLNPATKFIFILRDPIERTWSQMRTIKAAEGEESTAQRQFLEKPELMLRSDYMGTIQRILQQAPVENLLVKYFDEVVEAPLPMFESVCSFIGVPAATTGPEFGKAVYQGPQAEITPDLYDELRDRLRPVYDQLLELDSPYPRKWHRKHYG